MTYRIEIIKKLYQSRLTVEIKKTAFEYLEMNVVGCWSEMDCLLVNIDIHGVPFYLYKKLIRHRITNV